MNLIETNLIDKRIGLGLFDSKTGKEYGERRIIGGLAWPHVNKAGFAVMVAEERELDRGLNARHIRILAEVETADTSDLNGLFRRCIELQDESERSIRWFGDTANTPMMDLLRKFNEGQGRERLSLFPGKYINDFHGLRAYIGVINELTEPNRKVLHFGEMIKLPACLQEFQKEDVAKSASEFPAIAALGYAVSELYFHKPPQKWRGKPAYTRYCFGSKGAR